MFAASPNGAPEVPKKKKKQIHRAHPCSALNKPRQSEARSSYTVHTRLPRQRFLAQAKLKKKKKQLHQAKLPARRAG
jgi:hypothetical protein